MLNPRDNFPKNLLSSSKRCFFWDPETGFSRCWSLCSRQRPAAKRMNKSREKKLGDYDGSDHRNLHKVWRCFCAPWLTPSTKKVSMIVFASLLPFESRRLRPRRTNIQHSALQFARASFVQFQFRTQKKIERWSERDAWPGQHGEEDEAKRV